MNYFELVKHSRSLITQTQYQKLSYYQNEYVLLPKRIFEIVQEAPPPGLNADIIFLWLNKPKQPADIEQVKWVLEQCKRLEKFRII